MRTLYVTVHLLPTSVLDLPTVAPPTLTSDLCELLKEKDLLDSVADISLEVLSCIYNYEVLSCIITSNP